MKNITVLVVGIVAVVGIIGYFIYKSSQSSSQKQDDRFAAILATITGKKDEVKVNSDTDPTAVDWINSISGVLNNAGVFSFTKRILKA